MKNIRLRNLPAVCIGLTLLCITSCTCNRQTGAQQDPANYVYYLGQSPGAHWGNAKNAATALLGTNNLKGEFINNTGDGNEYYTDQNDPTLRFQQNPKTGNFSFNNSLANYLGETKPDLPSIAEAPSIAMDYLKKFDLLPADKNQLHVIHVGGVKSSAVINASKRGEEIDKMRTVVFTRMIDSTPVVGAGSKIVVQLGNNKALLGMVYRWKNINKNKGSNGKKFIPLSEQISQAEAQKEVKKRIISEFGNDAKYQIINSKKILYDGNENILQPVYSFEVKISAPIGKEQEGRYQYLYLIQAMKNSPETITIANTPPEAKRSIDTVKINRDNKRTDSTGKD